MKKILIVNDGFPPGSWGGSSTVSLLQAKYLKDKGYEVRVLTATQDAKAAGEYDYEGISARAMYTKYHPRWWAYKSLINTEITAEFERELKVYKPDVVHFHNIHNYFSYRCISIAKKYALKTCLTAHDVMSFAYRRLHNFIDYDSDEVPKYFNYHVPWWVNLKDARLRFNPLRSLVVRYYLRKVDKIFAVSNALRQALADNGIKGNVEVAHNGLDVAKLGPKFDNAAFKENLGLEGNKVVLFVGRFTPDKGRDVVLKSLALVLKNIPNTKLLVVGFDPKLNREPALEALSEALGLRDSIRYVASVPYGEIYKYYAISDCVVVPSIIFDSFPTVNLEAMAAGKPVAATCFGGSSEAVVDGVTGYVVNPLNIKQLADAVLRLLGDDQLAKKLGDAGYKRLGEKFSLDHQLGIYEKFYALE